MARRRRTSVQTLQVGDLGIDYSGARPDPKAIRRAGGRFIIRYSAGVGNNQPATQWKLCSRTEITDAVTAGLDVIANSEWYESRITEGASAGRADGASDLRFWQARDLAQGAAIYVSWDEYPDPGRWASAIAYLKAYDDALDGHFHVDCYAGTPFIEHALDQGVIRYGWRTNAGSWSNDGLPYQPSTQGSRDSLVTHGLAATKAHIWQTGNYWFDNGADEDLILRTPVGSHLEAQRGIATAPTTVRSDSRTRTSFAAKLVSPDGLHHAMLTDDGRIVIDGHAVTGPFKASVHHRSGAEEPHR